MLTRLRFVSLKLKLFFSVPFFIVLNYKSPLVALWHLLVKGERIETITLRSGLKFRIWGRRGHAILMENYSGCQYVKPPISLSRGDTVIDIGAHIGTFCVCLADRYPGVRILSFEPSESNFGLLVENVRLNGLEDSITPVNLAIAREAGFSRMFLSDNTGGNSLVFHTSDETVRVQTTTLGRVLDAYNIGVCDLLKIDAEGSEYQILMSANRETLEKIRQVSLEYSPSGNLDGSDIAEFLRTIGFSVRVHPNPYWNINGGLIFANRTKTQAAESCRS